MSLNPVVTLLGRRLRLAVIGGGEGSFIGPMHRLAARFDDRYETVCGIMSSNQDKAKLAGQEAGFAADRIYGTVAEMLAAEAARPDGVDVVSIMTPNDSHFDYAMAALNAGFDVICDKPMTNTLQQAKQLHAKVQQTGLIFCLTHNYTGYPMVRQARAMIQAGQLGEIRLVQVEYVQGGRAMNPAGTSPGGVIDLSKPRMWKFDPSRGGPSLVMGDIGTHAHNLLRFVTGLEVAEVAAEVGHIVPDRMVD
ncbi:MAG: Gfo/Idh/MocA family oxidoreductase, partial [Spirochaetota bacterium]